jgi:hypothetical protein
MIETWLMGERLPLIAMAAVPARTLTSQFVIRIGFGI